MSAEPTTDDLFFTTVLVETMGPDGAGSGTAFIFSLQEGTSVTPFLVTNRHVIAAADTGRLFFTRADRAVGSGGTLPPQPRIGQRVDLEIHNFDAAWHRHPDRDVDIAVMPLGPIYHTLAAQAKPVYVKSLVLDNIPTREQLDELFWVEDVLFLGYPNAIYDEHNLLPVARRGTTATPLHVDYGGRPAFLVDASVFPGSSGSPVVIPNRGFVVNKKGIGVGGGRLYFLGAISGVAIRKEQGRIGFVSVPTRQMPVAIVDQMIDLGYVIKARAVVEAIHDCLRARGLA